MSRNHWNYFGDGDDDGENDVDSRGDGDGGDGDGVDKPGFNKSSPEAAVPLLLWPDDQETG